MSEELKAFSRRFFEEVWNQGRREVLAELVDANCTVFEGGHKYTGPDVYRRVLEMTRMAFPDLHFKIDDQIAEGDKVVTRFTFTGTHMGQFVTSSGVAIPPTHKHTTMTGMTISRYQNGKLVEDWNNWDMHGLLQQLGGATLPARARE